MSVESATPSSIDGFLVDEDRPARAIRAPHPVSSNRPDPITTVNTTRLGLGPCWVRVATVAQGHHGSPTVANGSPETQVTGRPAQAAGMMRRGDSDCGPEGRARKVDPWLWAADCGCRPRFHRASNP